MFPSTSKITKEYTVFAGAPKFHECTYITRQFGIAITTDKELPVSHWRTLFTSEAAYEEFVTQYRAALAINKTPIKLQYDVAIFYADTPARKGCLVSYTFEFFKKLIFSND